MLTTPLSDELRANFANNHCITILRPSLSQSQRALSRRGYHWLGGHELVRRHGANFPTVFASVRQKAQSPYEFIFGQAGKKCTAIRKSCGDIIAERPETTEKGKLMRMLLVLICSISLASLAPGAEEGKKKEKKGAQAGQVSKPGGKPAGAGKPTGVGNPTGVGKSTGAGGQVGVGKPAGKAKGKQPGAVSGQAYYKQPGGAKGAATGKPAKVGKATGAGKPAVATTATKAGKLTATGKATGAGKPFKAQHFNLSTKTRPAGIPNVNFQQGRHVQGSQNWQGSNYRVFRNYSSGWHDRNWWHNHSNRVVFVFGGWYAWNAGWWYPAWGYAPNAYYAYDGPIYAYNNLPPDQVIANVQAALQRQGYYQGEVDGLLGRQTRSAIADYQRANGLVETAAIDQPTLQSLGMS